VWIIDFAHEYIDILAEGGNPANPEFDDNSLKGLDSLLSFTEAPGFRAKLSSLIKSVIPLLSLRASNWSQ
jgi:hypothetical protein